MQAWDCFPGEELDQVGGVFRAACVCKPPPPPPPPPAPNACAATGFECWVVACGILGFALALGVATFFISVHCAKERWQEGKGLSPNAAAHAGFAVRHAALDEVPSFFQSLCGPWRCCGAVFDCLAAFLCCGWGRGRYDGSRRLDFDGFGGGAGMGHLYGGRLADTIGGAAEACGPCARFARAAFSMVVLPFVCVKECFEGLCCPWWRRRRRWHEASWHKAGVGIDGGGGSPFRSSSNPRRLNFDDDLGASYGGRSTFGRSTTLPPRDYLPRYTRDDNALKYSSYDATTHHPTNSVEHVLVRGPTSAPAHYDGGRPRWGSSASEEPWWSSSAGEPRRVSWGDDPESYRPQTARSSYGRSPFGMY